MEGWRGAAAHWRDAAAAADRRVAENIAAARWTGYVVTYFLGIIKN